MVLLVDLVNRKWILCDCVVDMVSFVLFVLYVLEVILVLVKDKVCVFDLFFNLRVKMVLRVICI